MGKTIMTGHETSDTKHRREVARDDVKTLELIIFNLGDEEFAADIAQVREIINRGLITPIPNSPYFIDGMTNVRGDIAIVIGLKERFSLPLNKEAEPKHIIMTERDNNLFGLTVDEVTEVLRIPEEEIRPTPGLVTRIDRICINGVITLENRLIILLDLNKVLSEDELAELSKIRIKHSATADTAKKEPEMTQITAQSAE